MIWNRPTQMSVEDQALMASWAYEYGQAVRQLSNRQTTTMKKFGTMPDYMSIRNVAIGEKVVFPTGNPPPQPMGDEEDDDEKDYNDEYEGVAREDAIDEVQPDCVFEPNSDGQSDPEPIFEEASA